MSTKNSAVQPCECRGRGCNACEQTGMRAADEAPEFPEQVIECSACSGMCCAECGFQGYIAADLVIVGKWMKILTPRALDWCICGYGSELPSGCDLLSKFKVAYPEADAERARRAGLVVEVVKQ